MNTTPRLFFLTPSPFLPLWGPRVCETPWRPHHHCLLPAHWSSQSHHPSAPQPSVSGWGTPPGACAAAHPAPAPPASSAGPPGWSCTTEKGRSEQSWEGREQSSGWNHFILLLHTLVRRAHPAQSPCEMHCCTSDLCKLCFIVLSQIKHWPTQDTQLSHPWGPAPVQACWASPPGVASWLCTSAQGELLNHSTPCYF